MTAYLVAEAALYSCGENIAVNIRNFRFVKAVFVFGDFLVFFSVFNYRADKFSARSKWAKITFYCKRMLRYAA